MQLLGEHVAGQDEHRAVHGYIVASMHVADNAQMVGEGIVAVFRVEVSELGIDVELQQERHLRIVGIFPDNNSILVMIVVG